MKVLTGINPRLNSILPNREKYEDPDIQNLELEDSDYSSRSEHHVNSFNALEILRETVRILRYNSTGLMAITAFLICPVSGVLLSNVLVDQSLVKRLTVRLFLLAKSSGLPLGPFIKQSCHKFSEMTVSAVTCFPLFITLSLLAKAAVVDSVDCTYSRKMFDFSKFHVIVIKIWRRVVTTYLWACGVIVGCLTLFLVLLVAVGSLFSIFGFQSDSIMYPAFIVGLIFSIILANATIVCDVAIVISVLENVSGAQSLLRSSVLISGQTQVGLLIYLGSTIGMAFIEGLFQHRVKTLSYGDGSSRIWEGPLLVLMYSFVVLIDNMMTAVFYFSCKNYSMEESNGESQPVLEVMAISSGPTDIQ